MAASRLFQLQLLSALLFALHAATIHAFQPPAISRAPTVRRLSTEPTDDAVEGGEGRIEKVNLDGSGQDLTDRFKYKVHALMGTYDPPSGTVDDENQTGNIIGSLLQFPTDFTFSVVGKTSDGDSYANDVKSLMQSILGESARMETRVVPRGTKFTKVSVKVSVESAAMITSIYEELDAMELTVMKF